MATTKLYYEDVYKKEFKATITRVYQNSPTSFLLVFDKTLFFPESGGQPSDRGSITIQGYSFTVSSVSIDKDEVISHLVEPCKDTDFYPLVGMEVCGMIDFSYRFSNMQQHTGEHIFSGLVKSKFKLNNVGFHLSDNIVTMDYDGFLSSEELNLIETSANEIISKNLPVKCFFPSNEELAQLDYRCKLDFINNVRLVEIEGVDLCACCCPQVKNTGEISILVITSAIKYKRGIRISILCGMRALKYIDELRNINKELKMLLSSESNDIVSSVKKLQSDKISLENSLFEARFKLILSTAVSYGNKISLIFTEIRDSRLNKNLISHLLSTHEVVCILSSVNNNGYYYTIGSKLTDLSELNENLKSLFSAKGGGSKHSIQGQLTSKKEEIENYLLSLFH